ncbi:acyl-CoA N-acyltransferase [Entophlyctis helioformis]|nr:acyl-CoA N-acyltransferase [Entophlyctis helioformis]
MSSSGRDHHAPDELDEVAVGGIGLTFGDPTDIEAHTAELGYWLGEAFWGQGIMEATVRAFMGEHVEGSVRCDGERPVQLSRVVAVVAAANVGSSRVLEKNGFELEGRLRRYWFKRGEYGDGLQYSKVWP